MSAPWLPYCRFRCTDVVQEAFEALTSAPSDAGPQHAVHRGGRCLQYWGGRCHLPAVRTLEDISYWALQQEPDLDDGLPGSCLSHTASDHKSLLGATPHPLVRTLEFLQHFSGGLLWTWMAGPMSRPARSVLRIMILAPVNRAYFTPSPSQLTLGHISPWILSLAYWCPRGWG